MHEDYYPSSSSPKRNPSYRRRSSSIFTIFVPRRAYSSANVVISFRSYHTEDLSRSCSLFRVQVVPFSSSIVDSSLNHLLYFDDSHPRSILPMHSAPIVFRQFLFVQVSPSRSFSLSAVCESCFSCRIDSSHPSRDFLLPSRFEPRATLLPSSCLAKPSESEVESLSYFSEYMIGSWVCPSNINFSHKFWI